MMQLDVGVLLIKIFDEKLYKIFCIDRHQLSKTTRIVISSTVVLARV